MSRRLPTVRGMALLRALLRAGFIETRVIGSHHFMRHPNGRAVSVPVHGSRDVPRGLLSQILDDAGLSADELRKLL